MLVNPDIDAQLARLQLRLMSKKAKARPGYAELIEELSEIIARLKDKRSQSAPSEMAVGDPNASASSPTPFLGRKQTAELTTSNGRGRPVANAASDGDLENGISAPSESLADDSLFLASAKPSRALKMLTIVSALVLALGLALYLFGPLPSRSEPDKHAAAVPIDAGMVTRHVPAPDAAPPALGAPENMFIVYSNQRERAFYVAKTLVPYGDYSAIFPREKRPTKNVKRQRTPVDNVSRKNALSYARIKGARLISSEEWRAAQKNENFETQKWMSEWLAEEAVGGAPQSISSSGKVTKRRARPYKSVGFRLAIDP